MFDIQKCRDERAWSNGTSDSGGAPTMNDRSLPKHLQVLSLCLLTTTAIAYPTVYPTGTTIYDPDAAHSSYILISDHASLGNHPSAAVRAQSVAPDDVRLIDMNGNVVHTWT